MRFLLRVLWMWRITVCHGRTRIWGNLMLVSPTRVGSLHLAIMGLEQKHTAQEITVIRRGLSLLWSGLTKHGGRPPGSGLLFDRESLLAVFGRAVAELHAAGRPTTMPNVLAHVRRTVGDIHKTQLWRWVHNLGWSSWQDFVDEALRTEFV